jgi:hypothetical protein
MTTARAVATTFAAFLVAQILAIGIHGFVLAADYAPFYGNLLRDSARTGPGWQALLLPVSHLCLISGLVWIYGRLSLEGSQMARGLKLGVIAWLVSQAPLYLLWYAEQPWPDSLVVKQLGLELIASIAVGLTIAFVSRLPARPLSPRVATV